ncbi:rod shape-determining protein MreD [Paenibacillus sp. cl130]|nr:rod shape-determining protein MreD [Paenibacillus sp. cl130]
MSKFEKNLFKYLSYGFLVGIYYSFIQGPTTTTSSLNGSLQLYTVSASTFIFRTLSTSFLLSLLSGVVYTIVFLSIRRNK